MPDLMQQSWIVLVCMALLLGIQHGFDLDHLATIDSMTRTVSGNRKLSRKVGMLFSFGHGLVVMCISVMIGSGLLQTQSPEWLNGFGSWISIGFLFIFGLMNLWNVFHAHSKVPHSSHILYYLFNSYKPKRYHTIWIISIGALFAFSFDTFSQVALFSISASMISGCLFSLTLGVLFMLGMMISDGANGLFVSMLIQRADKTSMLISRMTGLLIAFFSLIIAVINLSKQLTTYA